MKYHDTAICPFAKFALFSGFFSVFAGQASFWLQSAVLSLQNLRSLRASSWTQSNLIQCERDDDDDANDDWAHYCECALCTFLYLICTV